MRMIIIYMFYPVVCQVMAVSSFELRVARIVKTYELKYLDKNLGSSLNQTLGQPAFGKAIHPTVILMSNHT